MLSILVVSSMQFLDSNLLPRHQNSLTSALFESLTFFALSPSAWHTGCWVHRRAWWWDWHRRAADLLWGRRAVLLHSLGPSGGYCPSISPNITPDSGLRSSGSYKPPRHVWKPLAAFFQLGFLLHMILLLLFLMANIFQI